MGENTLTVALREPTGKGAARQLRATGRIPAVLYGRGQEPVKLSLDPRVLERVLHQSEAGMNTLFDLALEGDGDLGKKVVLVKELQREPVHGGPLHADLLEIDLTQTVEVAIPLHVIGEAQGVKMGGGILDHSLRELRVECMPQAIPDGIEVGVSELEIGDSLHVRDLRIPEGVTVLEDGDLAVLSIVAPIKEEVPAEAVAAEAEAEAAAAAEAPAGEEAAAEPEATAESKE